MLRGGVTLTAGLAALALVGCSDDDEEDEDATAVPTADASETAEATATTEASATAEATPTAEATATAEAVEGPGGVVIEQVVLADDTASVVIANDGDAAQSLSGWFLCNFPAYWPFPEMELAAGARITVHAGAGDDSADELFANGDIGSLSGDGAGEIAIYNSNEFGSADAIVSYIAWNGGAMRKEVAQAAGIWGDTDVEAAAGDTISHVGGDPSAEAYSTDAAAGGDAMEGPGGIVVEQVTLAGDDASVVIANDGDAAQSLTGWFLCNFPAYWPFPEMELAAGARITVHAGAGDDTADELFADGGIGSLSGDGAGEFAIYSSNEFGSAAAIISYIGWNGGGQRKEVAQAAGIWGEADVAATADSVTISHVGGAPGAEAYAAE